MSVHSARPWQKPRIRRRGRRLMFLKRSGFAFLLLAGSATARSVYADPVTWTLASDGEWNVAAN